MIDRKGVETKVPSEDAEAIEPPSAEVILTAPELDTLNELLNQAENISITEFDEEVIKIEQKKRQDVQQALEPLQQELREISQIQRQERRLTQKLIDRSNAITFTINVIKTERH